MEHQEAVAASRQRQLVPDDKFDTHFRRARKQDILSRRKIFDIQTEISEQIRGSYKNILTSVY